MPAPTVNGLGVTLEKEYGVPILGNSYCASITLPIKVLAWLGAVNAARATTAAKAIARDLFIEVEIMALHPVLLWNAAASARPGRRYATFRPM
jgi:hypothetical protein